MSEQSTPTQTNDSSRRIRFFDDGSRHLDRFGVLFALVAVTVALAGVVNLKDAFNGSIEEGGNLFLSYSMAAMLMLALAASGVTWHWQVAIGCVVGTVLVAGTAEVVHAMLLGASHLGSLRSSPVFGLAAGTLALAVVLRRLLKHREVDKSTLLGALSAYLLIPLIFFCLYLVVDVAGQEPFFGHPASTPKFMYFSLTTLTTSGSDLQPASDAARLLTASETVIGQVYLVTFVAMIVGLMATKWRNPRST